MTRQGDRESGSPSNFHLTGGRHSVPGEGDGTHRAQNGGPPKARVFSPSTGGRASGRSRPPAPRRPGRRRPFRQARKRGARYETGATLRAPEGRTPPPMTGYGSRGNRHSALGRWEEPRRAAPNPRGRDACDGSESRRRREPAAPAVGSPSLAQQVPDVHHEKHGDDESKRHHQAIRQFTVNTQMTAAITTITTVKAASPARNDSSFRRAKLSNIANSRTTPIIAGTV